MSLYINNQYDMKRQIAKNLLLAVRTVMHEEQVDMVAGNFNGAWWRCQFHMAPQLYWDWVWFQENGPTCAVSSSHLVPKLSGIFACTARSKFLTKLLESNILTRVATTKYGFIFYMYTHGWLIAHLVTDNIGGKLSGEGTVRTTTSGTTWPSTQEPTRLSAQGHVAFATILFNTAAIKVPVG